MKMLVNRTAIGTAQPFDLEDLKAHLRVNDTADDTAITIIGQTAAAETEHFTQTALLTTTIRVTIFDPDHSAGLDLPIGPVISAEVPTVTIDGDAFTGFDFVTGIRPYIRWHASYHSLTPHLMLIEYQAGFGAAASDIPQDLAQAIMDQAALHYDGRSPMDARSLTTSPHMARVGARYRGVRA